MARDFPGGNAPPSGGMMQMQAEKAYISNPRPSTQREALQERKQTLEAQLERVTHAIEMLDKYPDFESVMNAVMQANY